MRFKMASRNPFRDFVRNLRRISISKYTDEEKDDLFHELWYNLSPKLSETSGAVRHPGPTLGEHNDYVWSKLAGKSPEELSILKEQKII